MTWIGIAGSHRIWLSHDMSIPRENPKFSSPKIKNWRKIIEGAKNV